MQTGGRFPRLSRADLVKDGGGGVSCPSALWVNLTPAVLKPSRVNEGGGQECSSTPTAATVTLMRGRGVASRASSRSRSGL
ncbi:hypothetical protein EYF80_064738 [Liparis tanakae]|uniref:Uncharacterized protein n=1 Tax=Liparis tanakae TaxID=230148 RepID=A0A4Z2E9D3_9TELE|nr:hypothetical protein EYF80_064738 [Liparis tanakae]